MTIRGKAAGRLLWVAALLLAAIARTEAGATSIVLKSDPGDYIGQGQTLAFTAADGAFQAYGSPADVTVSFSGQGHWWYLQFRTADGQPVAVGPMRMQFVTSRMERGTQAWMCTATAGGATCSRGASTFMRSCPRSRRKSASMWLSSRAPTG